MNTINWDVEEDVLYLNFRHIGTFVQFNRSSKSLNWVVGHLQGFTYTDAKGRPSRGFLSMHEVTKVGHNRFVLLDNEVDTWGFSQQNITSEQRVRVEIPEIKLRKESIVSNSMMNSIADLVPGSDPSSWSLDTDSNGTHSNTTEAKFVPTSASPRPVTSNNGSCIVDLTVHPSLRPGTGAVVQEHFRWCFQTITKAMGCAQPLPYGHYLGHNAMRHRTTIRNAQRQEVWSMEAARPAPGSKKKKVS